MIILREKIFFEETDEIRETKKNIKRLKKKVINLKDVVLDKIKHPKRELKIVGNKIKTTYNRYKEDPSLLEDDSINLGKKAVNYIKENPRDAVYLLAGGALVPAATGKIVGKLKGAKAGATAAGIAAMLPIGETAMATDHFVRSKEGKTAIKAAGQVISGTTNDIKNKFKKGDSIKK